MPINVLVRRHKGWFSSETELVIEDPPHMSIVKICYRVLRMEDFSILTRINDLSVVSFRQKELPILLEELKIYRDRLDTHIKELEDPMFTEEEEKYWTSSTKENWRNFFKISDKERDTIRKLIKIVEDNIKRPGVSIIFDYLA